MAAEDDELARRLNALKGLDSTAVSDDELMMRVQALRGDPIVLPRPKPSALLLPGGAQQLPQGRTAADEKISSLIGAIEGRSAPNVDGDDADALLWQAADVVRLGGGPAAGASTLDDVWVGVLASSDSRSPPSPDEPSRAQLRGLGDEATAILADARAGLGASGQHGDAPHLAPHLDRHLDRRAGAGAVGGRAAGEPACRGGGLGGLGGDWAAELVADLPDSDDEAEEAEELLRAMQESIELEAADAPSRAPPQPHSTPSAAPSAVGGPGQGGGLAFPSAPTAPPTAPPKPVGGGGVPGAARGHAASSADDEMARWCIICSEDATCWCLGCDDDPYCTRCWREGHVGRDATLVGHRTVPMRAGSTTTKPQR